MTPQHKHDCTTCKFLGRLGKLDMYWHDQPSGVPDYILRFSSDGPDYTSWSDYENRIFGEFARQYGHPNHWSVNYRNRFLRRMTGIKLLASAIAGHMEDN